MPSSRTSSPGRSQGSNSSRRQYKPRGSRSVGSPSLSNSSIKLSSVIQMNSFALSPILSRRSVLTDTTDIDLPRRKSWWRKLDENSREIMEVLNNKDPAEANNAIEEYIEVDVLSQEKKNYTMDLPESSDGESINSIIIPPKKLFTQKESKPQKKFAQIIDNRESLAPLHKTQAEVDKTINISRKNLFNQGTKNRPKPLFPSALLNMSANKTIANKTKVLGNSDAKTQIKSLFANRPGTKRKNMFANFIVSDSEDEIPEIQPKVFELKKKVEQKRRRSFNRRDTRFTSLTSSMTDIELDEWRLLPSSTMVDHQLEDGLKTTPNKRARLTKLSEGMESINTESNITTNKTKQSNKSISSKRNSKNLSQFKEMEINELIYPITNIPELDKFKENTKSGTENESQIKHFREHNKSKNLSLMKTNNKVVYEVNEKNADISRNKSNKSVSNIDQVIQNKEDEDFSLVYESYDNNEVQNDGNSTKNYSELNDPKETSIISKFSVPKNISVTKELQRMSKSLNTTHQPNEKYDNDVINQKKDKSCNNSQNNLQSTSTNEKIREISESENNNMLHAGHIENDRNISWNCKKVGNHENDKKQLENKQDSIDKHEKNREPNIYNKELNNKDDDHEDGNDDMSNQSKKHFEDDQESVNVEINSDPEVSRNEQTSNIVDNEERHSNDSDLNFSQEEENDTEEIIEEQIHDHSKEKNKDCEDIDNQINEEQMANIHDVELGQNDVDNVIQNVEDEINQQDEEITRNERCHLEVKQNLPWNVKNNEIINKENNGVSKNLNNFEDDGSNETTKNTGTNLTVNDIISRHRQKKDASPEVILHEKPSQMESFTVQGRNTSVRKTKSVIKNLTIRPSLAPVRESIDISNGSRNSSMEGSGWDSHRTTRRTLRQTFGKDFTPRKSLRTLVMEKSAKRHTNFTEMNAEFSRFPQANSTELPGSVPLAMDQTDVSEKMNGSHNKSTNALSNILDGSGNAHKVNLSNQEALVDINVSDDSKEIYDTNHDLLHDNENAQQINKMDASDQEMSGDVNYCDEQQKNKSHQEMNDFDVEHNTRDDQVVLRDIDNSDEEQKCNEFERTQENNESEQAQESNDSDDGHDMDDSNRTMSQEINDSDEALNNDESNDVGEIVESDNEHKLDESEQELTPDINNSDEEVIGSSHEVLAEIDEVDEESTTIAQEISESTDAREEEESDDAREEEESDDAREEEESDDAREEEEPDDSREEDECDGAREEDESENDHEIIESNCKLPFSKDHNEVQKIGYDHENSQKMRQTTLEMYLQKVKNKNLERKKQVEDEIRNSLNAPGKDIFNPFKVPAVPKLRRVRTQPIKPKAKMIKPSVISLNMLPVEVLEDMKYKPPKRYRPTNASWITKRLYKYLESKLETKYDYKARIRSEKLVETIYNFTKDIRRHSTAPQEAVDALKREMARLNVVKTHFEFYEFFHEYMPREVRVKVVPDLFNKISLPKYGVFSDILP